MATKNLARTVIEGGRIGYYKTNVRTESRSERMETRAALRAATKDIESVEEKPSPKRRSVHPEFGDKLSPLFRYLDSRVGKSWNKTYAEIRDRFDTRSTPGRHVVEGHLLHGILLPGQVATEHRYYNYFVDKVGILRKSKDVRYKRPKIKPTDVKDVLAFVGSERIGKVGIRYEWRQPTRGNSVLVHDYHLGGFAYVHTTEKGKPIIKDHIIGTLGQKIYCKPHMTSAYFPSRAVGLMTKQEEHTFLSFPAHVRDAVIRAGAGC